MENTSIRLNRIMRERGLRQVDILNLAAPYCEQLKVKLNKSDLSQFVKGKVAPGQWKLTVLGRALNVSEAWLMGYDVPMDQHSGDALYNAAKHAVYNREFDELSENQKIIALDRARSLPTNIAPLPKMKKVPLVGQIACGPPILAEENIEDYVDLPSHIRANFALTCKGESMTNAGIQDGDIVYIRQQEEVENGQIAAVLVDDDEATLKRFYFDGNTVQLVAENPRFMPMVYYGDDINRVHVIGLAVAYTHVLE